MPNNMNNLVFLTNGLTYGGAEIQLLHIALRLKQRGWKPRVVCLRPPLALDDQLEAAGIPVSHLQMKPGVPDPRAIIRFAGMLRRWKPDIVHSHQVHANLLGRLTRALAPVPVLISTAHNSHEASRPYEEAYKLTDWLADVTTNVSQMAVDRYISIGAAPASRIQLIYNGIDTTCFKPNATSRQVIRRELNLTDEFAWLMTGRFEEAKNHRNLINAFSSVHQKHPQSRLFLVGQGPLQEEIENLVAATGLQKVVRFLGARRDVADLLNGMDGFVLPSSWEGMALVLLEAAAVGLPCVATNVGGASETFDDGKNGFLVPPRDADALSTALVHVMDMPAEQRKGLGLMAREKVVAHYDIERTVDKWEALYTEMLSRNTRPSRKGQATSAIWNSHGMMASFGGNR